MNKLSDKDIELINIAKKAISKNYDKDNFKHTVGSAVRCKSGKVYIGVNVYSVLGACAEIINTLEGARMVKVSELLPYAYCVEN